MLTLPSAQPLPLTGGPVLRWGILAPGHIASVWVGGVQKHTEQQVVAVASRTAERAQAFADRFDIPNVYDSYEALVADAEVEAVYIAAPHSEHRRLALLAIAAGKHVLIEKPIAPSVAEAQQIVDAARAAGVFAMEATWTRFLPQSTVIAQLLEAGTLGEIVSVTADFGFRAPADPTGRLLNPALAGGALLDVGVYTAWFSQFVLGSPATVTARGTLAATGVDDNSTVILDFEGGAQSVLRTSLRADIGHTASINGTEGRLVFSGPFWAPSAFTVTVGEESATFTDESGVAGGEGLAYEAAAVAHYVAAGLTESPWHPLDATLAIARVLDEARTQLGYPPVAAV